MAFYTHSWAYAAVDNLLRKSNAERRSFVLCHWSLAAANKQAGERGTRDGGQGTRELPKRQTAAEGRESGFGNRRSGFAARGSSLVARSPWLFARRSWLAGCKIRDSDMANGQETSPPHRVGVNRPPAMPRTVPLFGRITLHDFEPEQDHEMPLLDVQLRGV